MSRTKKYVYGNKVSPKTVIPNMEKIRNLFAKKEIVSFKDMQKATKRIWVRGYFDALKKTVDGDIVAIRKGRKLKGFALMEKIKRGPGRPRKDEVIQRKRLRKVA